MLYLSGHVTCDLPCDMGFLHQPRSGHRVSRYHPWAADNGCFTAGESFSMDRYLAWLDRQPRVNCLWATAPDVVGDHQATIERSLPEIPSIRGLGYQVAFVAQDGATVANVPWGAFSCLFIGGSTIWKLGVAAELVARHAVRLGKWLHMGRVNSERRYRYAKAIGCHSVDGTFLAFAPKINRRRLLAWPSRRQGVLALNG